MLCMLAFGVNPSLGPAREAHDLRPLPPATIRGMDENAYKPPEIPSDRPPPEDPFARIPRPTFFALVVAVLILLCLLALLLPAVQ